VKYRTILSLARPARQARRGGFWHIPDFYHCACGDVFRNLTIDSELGRIFRKILEQRQTGSRTDNTVDSGAIISRRRHNWAASSERDTPCARRHSAQPPSGRNARDALDVSGVFISFAVTRRNSWSVLQRRARRENRLDDARLEVIKKRLAIYEKETKPILDH